jgi:ABC-type multidrug transport system fused ATPase/permease subunit
LGEVIGNGSVPIQIGSHAELMAQPEGLYHSLVKRQLLGAVAVEKPGEVG